MAKKRNSNPLSGMFHDPPKEADAPAPGQQEQNVPPVEPPEVPAGAVPVDTPAPEQADQGDVPAEQSDPPVEHGDADAPIPEQADQGEAPAAQNGPPAEHGDADAPVPEQADQGEAPAAQNGPPVEPGDVDAPGPEQADQGDVPAEQNGPPVEHGDAGAPAPEQADQSDVPTEQNGPPVEHGDADTPAPEQADQGDAPATEQNNSPDVRFVQISDIKPLTGTYVKDFPREDYGELIASIKEHGLEKPIILRAGANGDFQLVDGFHRCEAMKQAGFLEVKAEVYDMTPLEASRYRREHRTNPDLPIPGKLIPAHPPKEEPAAEPDASAEDKEEFELPQNFTLPITKEGQSEIVTTLKVSDIHPFEGHPFNVLDNKDMWDLRDSVQRYGVMEPVMVINRPAGGYEMVSGHRRLRACQLAGIQTVPAIVRNLDRDEATIAMVDANLKREKISPMEMARALAMKSEALRRKVGRRSKAEIAAGEKPLTVDEELAKQTGESVANIQRYKTLNKLVPEMQEMVDKGQVPLNTGADIAQLKPEEQKQLADAIQKEDKVPTGAQVKEMKKQSADGTLTTEAIRQSVAPTKREENPPLKITLGEEDLRPYFPDKKTTVPDVKHGIFEALALRQKLQERQRAKAQQAAEPKNETKPPDKSAAGGGQKPTPPVPDTKAKTPTPTAGGGKRASTGKKPAPGSKAKKPGPAR